MKVIVAYSGQFRTVVGKKKEPIEIAEGETLNQLIDILDDKYNIMPLLEKGTIYVVNHKIAKRDQVLADGDEIHIFQMMAGG